MTELEKAANDFFPIDEKEMSLDEQSDQLLRQIGFKFGANWQLDHLTSDYAWKIYNFIWDYKNGKFGEDLTLQQAIDKYFKDWKQND